jgi:signal peptidase I
MMRFRRFLVEGDSMLPTLRSGEYVVGHRVDRVAPLDIVAFEHPHRPGFWLLKRVMATAGTIDLDAGTLDGEPYDDPYRDELVESGSFEIQLGEMFVLSDNRRSTRADSRVFGAIPIKGSFRIRFRYWPRPARL